MANTRSASRPPTIVPVTSRPRPRGVNSSVGTNSLGGGSGLLPRNSMNSRNASCSHTKYRNARMAPKKPSWPGALKPARTIVAEATLSPRSRRRLVS